MTAAPEPTRGVRVEGTACLLLAMDVGRQIDLDAAGRVARASESAQRELIKHTRRGPEYLQFRPAPLRLDQPDAALDLGPARTSGPVELTLFDFGAVSVMYRVPFSGPLESLMPLAAAMYENAALLADARRRVEDLLARLGAAVQRPALSPLVEDYVVYHVRRWEPAPDPGRAGEAPGWLDASLAAHAPDVARLLRAETTRLSARETEEATACRIGFGDDDAAVIDWNAALLIDPAPDDVVAVLEFANVELLEMRFLDDRLDGILEEAYARIGAGEPPPASGARGANGTGARAARRRSAGLLGVSARERRRIATLQLDSAMLFEGINNAVKLVGDPYLARVYRLAAERFHLADWDASILRKLRTLEDLHQSIVDEQAARRMELLEIIIIVLIAVSIVLPFLPVGK